MSFDEKPKFKHTEVGMIPEEWDISTIDSIASSEKSSLAMGPFGSNITKDNFIPFGVPVIRGNNLTEYRFLDSQFAFLSEEKADELHSANAKSGDIIITHRGTLGQVGIIPKNPNFKRYVVSQSGMKLTCDDNKIVALFVFYWLKSPKGQQELLKNTSQTGVPAIAQPLSSLRKVNLPLPPLPEQNSIAKILSDLDSKIELNQQMNKTLEAIGHAIFKRWFVDFEFPNEEGKPYKSSGGKMDSSDFGEIPYEWITKPFSEVIAVNPLRKIEKDAIAKKVEMSNLNPWQPWIDSWVTDSFKSGSRFQNGDTLLARITPCLENGKTALVSFLNKKEVAFGSTEFIVLGPKIIQSSYYILYLAINNELRASAILSMTGSSGRQRVPNDFFDDFIVAVPPNELLRKFDSLVAPPFEKVTNNIRESRSLSMIRDNLLPRLMSGKIRIPVPEGNMEGHRV